MIKKNIPIILGALSLSPFVAQAAAYHDYSIGVSAGSSYYSTGIRTISENIDYDRLDTGFSVSLRKNFSKDTGLEINYTDFGQLQLSGPNGQQFFFGETRIDLQDNANLRVSATGIGINGIFRTWVTSSFSAGVRIGYQFWSASLQQTGLLDSKAQQATAWKENDSGSGLYYSLGFYYDMGSLELGLRAETARFGGELLEDTAMVLLNLNYGFRL